MLGPFTPPSAPWYLARTERGPAEVVDDDTVLVPQAAITALFSSEDAERLCSLPFITVGPGLNDHMEVRPVLHATAQVAVASTRKVSKTFTFTGVIEIPTGRVSLDEVGANQRRLSSPFTHGARLSRARGQLVGSQALDAYQEFRCRFGYEMPRHPPMALTRRTLVDLCMGGTRSGELCTVDPTSDQGLKALSPYLDPEPVRAAALALARRIDHL